MYFCNTSFFCQQNFYPVMIKHLRVTFASTLVKISSIMLLLFVVHTESKAQSAEYAIKWHHSYDLGDTLTVYMRSSTTILFPFNQVSTSQVTLRVPTGMLPFFNGNGLQTTIDNDTLLHHDNGHWSNNARFSVGDSTGNPTYYPLGTLGAHEDGNSYDYVSFGLTSLGTPNIEFVAGDELPLFSFIFPNTSLCTDSIPIHILDHVEDTSFIDNGITSPNNNMSVLGPGDDIYAGNYWDYGARCYDYDNDDEFNPTDLCDYTLEVDIPNVDTSGCTDFDGDGFHPDDNPTPADEDASTTTNVIDPPAVTETYNNFDTDINNQCIPQGDSLRGYLSIFDAGVEFSNGSTTICAGEPIDIVVRMIETESTDDANTPASPYDYDHRGVYNITINSSLGGDMTVPGYTSGDTITVNPTEDGTVFSLVQVVDTFLCNAIDLDSTGQVFVETGADLAIIDGDQNICDGDSAVISISISGGNAGYLVTYAQDGVPLPAITMTGTDTTITINGLTASTEYTLVSVVDSDGAGCATDPGSLIGAATITFADKANISSVDVVQPSDCNLSDGTITVNLSPVPSGTVEYSNDGGLTWQPGNVFTVGTGNFNMAVRVNGNNNCMTLWPTTIAMSAADAPIFGAVQTTDPTECTNNDGQIEVFIQAPNPLFTLQYQLEIAGGGVVEAFGVGDSLFTGLSPDNYVIKVRYLNGATPQCEVSFPGGAEIDSIEAPSFISVAPQDIADCDEVNGEIGITAGAGTGGTVEYLLAQTSGTGYTSPGWGSQNSFLNLPVGTYTASIRNANGQNCQVDTTTLTVARPDSLTLSSTVETDITVCGGTNGQIVITAIGDLPGSNIEYSIDGGNTWQASGTFSNIAEGIYNASIRNSTDQSCETTSGVADTITAPEDILQINPTSTEITDCGADDATLLAQVASFDNNYTLEYELDAITPSNDVAAQASPNFSGLAADTYDVIVSYASGATCSDTLQLTVDALNDIVINSIDSTDSQECGLAEGEVQIHATGVDGAIEFTIDSGITWQQGNVFSSLGDITIDVQVRYADGTCLNDYGTIDLDIPEVTAVDGGATTHTDPTQCGTDDGTITVSITTGTNSTYSIDGTTFTNDSIFTGLSGGTYLVTIRDSVANSCFDTLTVALTGNVAPELEAKVFLQGPYNTGTGLMNDDLREASVIPLDNPYIYSRLLDYGADTVDVTGGYINESDTLNPGTIGTIIIGDSATVLGDNGSNSIVDWIIVELRPFYDSSSVTARRVALVQRDGDIVEYSDGITSLTFNNTCATADTTYYVSVKHRNHMGVMTANPVAFDSGDPVSLDFTTGDLETFTKTNSIVESQASLGGGLRALWGGNVAFNRQILFQGDNPDSGLIGKKVAEHPDNDDALANFILKGYYNSDVNMDGVTIFQGAPNDVDILFFNVMGNPANTSFNANFILGEQIPGDGL